MGNSRLLDWNWPQGAVRLVYPPSSAASDGNVTRSPYMLNYILIIFVPAMDLRFRRRPSTPYSEPSN